MVPVFTAGPSKTISRLVELIPPYRRTDCSLTRNFEAFVSRVLFSEQTSQLRNTALKSAAQMPDKFKCPNCGSGRTKPLSIAVSTGTRRRGTVGLSSRSVWSSQSTYKSDFVSSLPARPSNVSAYLLVFLGACGLLFAWVVGAGHNAAGFATLVALVSMLVIVAGFGARKSPNRLTSEQHAWDGTWLCARCGHQWQQ